MSSEESPVTRIVVCCIALWAYLLSAAGAVQSQTVEQAAETAKPLGDRWVPAISSGLLVFNYEAMDGAIDTSLDVSSAGESTPRTIPVFQIGLDLMSPSLQRLPAAPRIVGFAGVQVAPHQDLEVAGVAKDKDVGFDPDRVQRGLDNITPPPAGLPWRSADSFKGQGSELIGKYLSGGWYLGLGMAFEIPNRQERDPLFRVTPFVSYVGDRVKIKGDLMRVTGQRIGPPGGPFVEDYKVYRAAVASWETFHYLGPGIDAEVVVASGEATTLSLFGRVSFLWNVGSGSVSLSDPNEIATYTYTPDNFSIRPGGGLRLSWRGGL